MKKEDKYIARIQFKLKVLQSKGQTFEDFFVSVMTKADKDFQPVKAYGNIGDQKNDGFNKKTGTYSFTVSATAASVMLPLLF